jgi:hypothetical protein
MISPKIIKKAFLEGLQKGVTQMTKTEAMKTAKSIVSHKVTLTKFEEELNTFGKEMIDFEGFKRALKV